MRDLNAFLLFAKIADAKSFSAAARQLRMPVSTISRRIAELERDLDVRLFERSTRNLLLTELGVEILEQARRAVELNDSLDSIIANRVAKVSGTIRLSAPPSISDTLVAPIACAFQSAYPDTRVQVFVTDRRVDYVAEGIDLSFRLNIPSDSRLVARKMLTYRHQLVASPAYLAAHPPPRTPQDLHGHTLVAFTHWQDDSRWTLIHAGTGAEESVDIMPRITMNDYAGLATILLNGGIGDLPPVVQPELLQTGRLVEVMPGWRFRAGDLSVVHLAGRHITPPVRLFRDFAAQMAPTLFPDLPV
jgi:DNA-binding transcriptional LysR family regulator